VIDLLHGELFKIEGLIQAAVSVAALAMVLYVWVKTKAVVPVVGAVLFGALITWAVHHSDFLQQKVDQEFHGATSNAAPLVTPGPGPRWGPSNG